MEYFKSLKIKEQRKNLLYSQEQLYMRPSFELPSPSMLYFCCFRVYAISIYQQKTPIIIKRGKKAPVSNIYNKNINLLFSPSTVYEIAFEI